MSSLISVIVPVYNVEKYLDRCVESILNQTYVNLEVILVDDGSKDSSGILCDEWARKDTRIKVVHKKNEGLGFARNTGLDNCTGDFIAFVDSDDFVDREMFEDMIAGITKYNVNTCYCSHKLYSNENEEVVKYFSEEAGVFTGSKVLLDILGAEPEDRIDFGRQMSVWGVLFSGNIIREKNIRFRSERVYMSEDLPFDVQYLLHVDNVLCKENCFYNYCINTESLTHRYYPDRLEREKRLYLLINDLMKDTQLQQQYRLRFDRLFLGRVRNCIMQEINEAPKTIVEKRRGIKIIATDQIVRRVITQYPLHKAPIKQRLFHIALKYRLIAVMYLLVKVNRSVS